MGATKVDASNTATLTAWLYGDGSNPSMFTNTVVDPGSGMAFSTGSVSTGGNLNPLLGTLNAAAAYAGLPNGYYGDIDYSSFGSATSHGLAVGPDGQMFAGVTGGTTTGPRYVDIYSFSKDPSDNWLLQNWGDEVVAVDPSKDLTSFSVCTQDDGGVNLFAADMTDVTVGRNTWHAYDLFSWGPDGTERQSVVLPGAAFHVPVPYVDATMDALGRTSAFSNSFLTLDAPTADAGNVGSHWYLTFIPGPDDNYVGKEDLVFNAFIASNVLRNDPTGFWGAPFTAGNPANLVGIDSVSLGSNGTFSATPTHDFSGYGSFTYDDIQGGSTVATHTVTINFRAVNDAPVAVDDQYTVASGVKTSLNVTVNDYDVEGDSFQIQTKTAASHGNVSAIDGQHIGYKPAAGWHGTDTFTYNIKDSHGAISNYATVTVTTP